MTKEPNIFELQESLVHQENTELYKKLNIIRRQILDLQNKVHEHKSPFLQNKIKERELQRVLDPYSTNISCIYVHV